MIFLDIRILKAKDAKAYWQLRLETLAANPNSFLLTMEEELTKVQPIKKVASQLKDPYRVTIGCFYEGKLIGSVTLQRETYRKILHKGSILSFFMKEEFRGKGIGRSLLLKIIEIANFYGIEQLILTVVSANTVAKALYQSIGFYTFGYEKRALKWNNQYFDEEHMVLFLQNGQEEREKKEHEAKKSWNRFI